MQLRVESLEHTAKFNQLNTDPSFKVDSIIGENEVRNFHLHLFVGSSMSILGRIRYIIGSMGVGAVALLVLCCLVVFILCSRESKSTTGHSHAAEQYPHIWKSSTDRDHTFIHTNSQFNEIGALIALAFESTVPTKFVVDIGARGKNHSNSYDLLKSFHWKGLLVDAHPKAIEDIKREFAGLDVDVVHSAVSDYSGTATFTLSHAVDTSSMTTDWTDRYGGPIGTITVPAERLPVILANHKVPKRFGLLSLDVEGQDVKVINDLFLNSDYRPEYIIIESLDGPKFYSLEELAVVQELKNDYYEMGRTLANLLLKRK